MSLSSRILNKRCVQIALVFAHLDLNWRRVVRDFLAAYMVEENEDAKRQTDGIANFKLSHTV